MKKARKLMAFLLAAVMVMGMTMSVSAENTNPHTITIDNSTSGYTYEAYQVFAGELHEGKLSNVEWGNGVNGEALLTALQSATINETQPFAGCQSAADVAEVLAKEDDESEIAKGFADLVADNLTSDSTKIATSEYKSNQYEIDVVGDGYYFVKNKDGAEGVPDENASRTRYLLQVVSDVAISHKGEVPTVEKDIVEGNDAVKVNEASIGDVIEYKITGTMPENIGDYNTYYYVFTDTLSEGLTYNDDIKIMIGTSDVTDYFYQNIDGNTITIGMSDILELENVTDVTPTIDITDGTVIEITYSATLNEKAEIAGVGNDNSVTLKYSNDPNQSGGEKSPDQPDPDETPSTTNPTGDTPTSKVTTYTTEVTIHKVDGSDKELAGAAFRITGASVKTVVTTGEVYVESVSGTYYKLADGTYTTTEPELDDDPLYASTTTKYEKTDKTTIDTTPVNVEAEAFVNSDGELTFTGLGAGEYTITEIVTPEGYNTAEAITFTISFDPATQEFGSNNAKVSIGDADNKFDVTVVNLSGSTLPSTGGMGTTIFYIVGGVLVLVAVVLLVTRKRMKKEEV